MDTITIRLYDIVGNNFCVAVDDGQKVYEVIRGFLNQKRRVTISFMNVEMVTAAFLNSAIGQLYNKEFEYTFLSESLSLEDYEDDDFHSLKRVIETAKLYYSYPERLSESIRKVMEG